MDASPQLSGRLRSFGLVPMARFLSSLGKSGDLVVVRGAWQARLCLDEGRLVAAVAGGEAGWPALEVVLLGMADADFEFIAGRPSLEPNLEAEDGHPLSARLLHLVRAIPAPGAVPGPSAVPRLTRVSGAAERVEVELDRASLAILLEVDGCSDVGAIADRHGRLRTLRALARLRQLKLVTFDGRAGRPPAAAVPRAASACPDDTPSVRPDEASLTSPRPTSAESAPGGRLTARRVGRPGRLTGFGLGLAALVASLAVVTQGVLFVQGASMVPSLRPGQLLVLNRAAFLRWDELPGLGQRAPGRSTAEPDYIVSGPQRGEVIVFRRGGDDDYVVKRVIGLPGDAVVVKAGQVFVNGALLDEPYVVATDDYTYPNDGVPVTVPDGAYFVLGDNRPVSVDSHYGWFVDAGDVVGQAWPLPLRLSA